MVFPSSAADDVDDAHSEQERVEGEASASASVSASVSAPVPASGSNEGHANEGDGAGNEDDDAMESLLARHRKEAKDMRAKIQSLKKAATKGDKKAKKESATEIALLEEEMEKRHRAEVDALTKKLKELELTKAAPAASEKSGSTAVEGEEDGENEEAENVEVSAVKKKNRQKQRKERKTAEIQAIKEQAKEEAASSVNLGSKETEKLKTVLQSMNKQIKQITADGHCLYNALSDQLLTRGLRAGQASSFQDLRRIAASYIRCHSSDFLPFLVSDSGDMFNDDMFDKYCDDIENTAAWGGQLEIQAISNALKIPIHVVQADGPVIKIGDEFEQQPLFLSYHRHAYGLGEHYNSLLEAKPAAAIKQD